MGDVMHTRVMLCNAAVQMYHNFRIQLDFFLFCQNFCLNPLRREASRNHSKTPLQRLFLMYEWVARAFQGRFGHHGVIWVQNALAKKKLQCLIVEKNHFNVVDWHCVFNVVDLPWELKEKKNKKKKYMGHLALASRTVTKQNIGLLVHGSMLISFFRNRGFWQIWKGRISLKNMANWRDLKLQKFGADNISLQAIFVAIW